MKSFTISESHLTQYLKFPNGRTRPKKITSQKRMAQDWLDHINCKRMCKIVQNARFSYVLALEKK